jgi:hypothetical protein
VNRTVTYVSCLNAATVIPQTSWTPGVLHTVTVSASVQSASGTPITPFQFTFTPSAGDTVRPTFDAAQVAPGTITTTSIDLTWTAATDDQPGVLTYAVYMSDDGCFDFSAAPQTVTIGSLIPNTLYSFVVRARDAAGNDDGNATTRTARTLVSFLNTLYNPIVNVICIVCHTPGGLGQHMVLSGGKDVALAAWVNVVPGDGAGTISQCDVPPAGVMFRVEPLNSADSLVWRKLTFTGLPEICGDRMPRGGPYLNDAQIQAFKDWIDQGALDN